MIYKMVVPFLGYPGWSLPMQRRFSSRFAVCGFTLVELAVVLAILGVVLLIAVPRLSIFEEAAFRSDARRVASLIRQLDDQAAAEKSFYKLSFAIGARSFEMQKSVDGDAFSAPERLPALVRLGRSTSIASVAHGSATREAGRAEIVFQPSGAEPFSISLESGGQRCTIDYNPYSGKVKII